MRISITECKCLILFKKIFLSWVILNLVISVNGQFTLQDCKIELKDNILSFRNSKILIEFYWNNGNIIGQKIANLSTGYSWELTNKSNEIGWAPDSLPPINTDFKVLQVVNDVFSPDHLVAEITTRYKNYGIRRTFRLYPRMNVLAMSLSVNKTTDLCRDLNCYFDERISLPGRQWEIQSIEFNDRTDQNNNLVSEKGYLSFTKPLNLKANILIATDLLSNQKIFIIKESPLGESQLLYPGYDFQVKSGEIVIRNLGTLYSEITCNQWIKCYGYVLGTGGNEERETLLAIRDYMKSVSKYDATRDEMVMMNTWGDRGQDGRINQDFVFKELQKGKELGITHLQLDDGWQQGLSKNSKSSAGKLWDQWSSEDWEPHESRFPAGLGPALEEASRHKIKIGLWFHPSNANSYGSWRGDAEILLDLYNRCGIKNFKIDGIELSDKNADINLRRILDTLRKSSYGEITFNVDVTAGRRGGYFYLNEYGNIYLENRYTDWGNYYPHWTLRNLWMLSKYIPPENLQIEFLNNTRNRNKYEEADPLKPSAIPFDYIFAITMAGQPLAFLESTGLPEEAFEIKPIIESYKNIMSAFHQGYIFPIGEIPDGSSWTGFQSVSDDKSGYFLIFRENNEIEAFLMRTYLPGGLKIRLKKILGYGDSFVCITNDKGEIEFHLPGTFNYALFHYSTKR